MFSLLFALRSGLREQQGDFRGSEKDFNDAVQSTPQSVETAHLYRGIVRSKFGIQGAAEDFRVAAQKALERGDMEGYQKITSLMDRVLKPAN